MVIPILEKAVEAATTYFPADIAERVMHGAVNSPDYGFTAMTVGLFLVTVEKGEKYLRAGINYFDGAVSEVEKFLSE